MTEAFFYRERKGMFVVAVLAIWFVLLGMFGRYLPANAAVNAKQMAITVHGTQMLGHWAKEDGRWKFQRISKIISFKRSASRKKSAASIRTSQKVGHNGAIASVVSPASLAIAGGGAPLTTAAVQSRLPRKVNKRELRARLADEIGRWAKIGNRWEWRDSQSVSHPARVSRPAQVRKEDEQQAQWIRRNGIWVFDVMIAEDLFINI